MTKLLACLPLLRCGRMYIYPYRHSLVLLSSRIYHEIYNDDLFGCFSN